jgi:hypothetical protein
MEVSCYFISQPLKPWGKNLWYSLDRRLGGPQSWYGCDGEEKDLLPLPGIELRTLSSSPWLVTIMTEIFWFQRGNIEGTKYLLI